jgi:hypothetical protein
MPGSGKLQETNLVMSRRVLSHFEFSTDKSMMDQCLYVSRFRGWVPEAGIVALFAAVSLAPCFAPAQQAAAHRPPAAPLIANDPYFSVWSMADKLTDVPTKHWSEAAQPLTGLIRIDGRIFRWMGTQPRQRPNLPRIEAMQQDALEVTPLHTRYRLSAAGVELQVSFLLHRFRSNSRCFHAPSHISRGLRGRRTMRRTRWNCFWMSTHRLRSMPMRSR